MPLLLGALASLFVGVSDTFGRASSQRADSVSHVAMQMLVGTAVSLFAVVGLGSTWLGADMVKGAISGVAIAAGLALVYRAMALSSAAVVSPTAAVLAAVIPLGWDLVGGHRLSGLESSGCAVAIVSLGLTTFNPRLGDRVRQGLALAVAGGVLFGLSIVLVADTATESGAWPAVAQRLVGFVFLIPIARLRHVPLLLPVGVRRFGVAGGLAGAAGMICWIVGAQHGDLGTVSVVGSTYPAVVAALSAVFFEDEIRWWQAIGIAGAIAGSIAIAIG